MKRKNKSRQSIGYQQLENRRLLAAIANGQEITDSFSAGGSATYELDVNSPGTVYVAANEITDQTGEINVNVNGPTGAPVTLETFAYEGSARTKFVSFAASETGEYSISISDVANDDDLGFSLKAKAVPSDFDLLLPGSEPLVNGEEANFTVSFGSFFATPLETDEAGTIVLSVGHEIGQPHQMENTFQSVFLVDGSGNIIVRRHNSGTGSIQLVYESDQADFYTVFVTQSSVGAGPIDYTMRATTFPSSSVIEAEQDVALANGEQILTTLNAGETARYTIEVESPGLLVFSADLANADLTPPYVSSVTPRPIVLGPSGEILYSYGSLAAAWITLADTPGTYTVVMIPPKTPSVTDGNEYRIRAAVLNDSIQYIPGQDALLDDGQLNQATIPIGSYSLVPIEVATPGTVQITAASQASDPFDPYVQVYSPSGNRVFIETGGSTVDGEFEAIETGTYLGVVSDDVDYSRSAESSFGIQYLVVGDTDDRVELLNGVPAAALIPAGSFVTYRFETDGPGKVILSSTLGADSLEVRDSEGNAISNASPLAQLLFEFDAPAADTFEIVVRSSAFDGTADVSISGIAVADDTDVGTDALIKSGAQVIADIGNTAIGVFHFDATENASIRVSAIPAAGYVLSALNTRIFDPDGMEVDISNPSGDVFQFVAPSSGRFTIIIDDFFSILLPDQQAIVRLFQTPAETNLIEELDARLLGTGSETYSADIAHRGFSLFTLPIGEPVDVFFQIKQQEFGSARSIGLELFDSLGNLVYDSSGSRSLNSSVSLANTGTYTGVLSVSDDRGSDESESDSILVNVFTLPDSIALPDGQETLISIPEDGTSAVRFTIDDAGLAFVYVGGVDTNARSVSVTILAPDGSVALATRNVSEPSGSLTLDATEAGEYIAVVRRNDDGVIGDADFRFRAVSFVGTPPQLADRDGMLTNGVETSLSLVPGTLGIYTFELGEPGRVFLPSLSDDSAFSEAGGAIAFYNSTGQQVGTSILFDGVTPEAYTARVVSGSFNGELALRYVVLNGTFAPTPGLEGILEAGDEFLSSISDGQPAVFPLVIAEPGPINVYVGEVGGVGGGLAISIYDELGIRVAVNSFVYSAGEVGFQAQTDKSYFAVVEADEPLDFRIRPISLTGTNKLIPDRDFVVGEGSRVGGGVPSGVTLAYLNVEQPGEMKFLYTGNDLTIYDPNRQTVDFDDDDGILTFSPEQVGEHFLVANGSSLGLRPFDVQLDNDRRLIDGLDHILQNGQEIAATLPAGGISVIPLDIDFTKLGDGWLTVAGTSESGSVIPWVRIFDIDGTEIGTNKLGSFTFRNDILLTSRFQLSEPRYAIVTNTGSSEAIDFTIRAANFAHPLALVPGRETLLEDGVSFTAQSLQPSFSYFPFEVETPGTVTVDFSSTTIGEGNSFFHMQLVTPAGQLTYYSPTINTEFDITEAGSYGILLRHRGPAASEFQIVVNGIARAKPAVTSFLRDSRLGVRAEVLAQPDVAGQLTFQFNQDVEIQAGDLVLRNDSTGSELVDISAAGFNYDPGTLTATWDLSTLEMPLPAGFYSASLAADSIASIISGEGMAETFSSRFHVAMQGDVNLNGAVDVLNDAFAFVGNLGTEQSALWSDGDFNGDGSVNVLGDAFGLVSNLGQSIVRPEVTSFQRDSTATEDQYRLSRPDLIENLTVDFNVDVEVQAADLILRNDSEDSLVDLSGATFTYNAVTHRAHWDLTTLAIPLPAGFYSVQILAGSVTEKADGQALLADYSDEFYVALPGDTNLDGNVDVLNDGFRFVRYLGREEFSSWSLGDFNDDDRVDVLGDAFSLVNNLGSSVAIDSAFAQFDG